MNKELILRLAVFVFSITQLLAPLFSSFGEKQKQNNFDPPITPAGYAFAIWGVINYIVRFWLWNISTIT